VLIVEDSAADAELLALRLEGSARSLEWTRAENPGQLRSELEGQPWDVIISDYSMPGFNGIDALKIVRQRDAEVPFILVSGSVGEDIAVQAMKAGGQDYIMKDTLARLAPAVDRELREAEIRRERRRLSEQLARSQRLEALGQLAGGVAHEFNNILMGIGGYAQLMSDESGLSSEAREDLESMRRLCARGGDLARELLTFSRAEPAEAMALNINSIVKSTAKMLRSVLPESVVIEVDPDPQVASIEIDPAQLEQVIVNLAVNARDAMPEGGVLILSTTNVEIPEEDLGQSVPGVRLSVSDTGCGMDEATRARIFEPFFTTKAPGKGNGLGLSAVYGIVGQHRGKISVESAPGNGTIFHLEFPAVPADERVEKDVAAAPVAAAGGTILLAEDDSSVRAVLEQWLRNRGYRVLAAADPGEAERLATDSGEKIELLVTDVTMPGKSGPELYRELCSACPGLEALFISGYFGGDPTQLENLPSGCEFMQKPFSLVELGNRVEEILCRARVGS
jgi:signal transduction histidine kinase